MNETATSTSNMQPAGQHLLLAANLSKRYGSVLALESVSFSLKPGEIHGLCGHNGAGKSTFVKVVTGQVRADTGTLQIAGTPVDFRTPIQAQAEGVALVDQELSLAPDLSVEENLFLGSIYMPLIRHPRRFRAKAQELLALVGLDHLDPLTTLSSLSMGERQLLEICRMVGRDARILILDEPTASLSDIESERVFAVIRRLVQGGDRGAIYISHRLDEVLGLCDRVTVFRDGRVVATQSSSEISNRQELIRLMVDVELPVPATSTATEVDVHGNVEIRGLTSPPLVRDFNLTIRAGEIIGLTGQVGSGVSEVARALGGLDPSARGILMIDGERVKVGDPGSALRAGVAFVSNDRKGEGLFLRRTVDANLTVTRLRQLSRFGIARRGLLRQTAQRLARFVQVDENRRGSLVETLSGGNQQKVFIGRCLDRPDVRMLVLDEPSRGVDVIGRAEIHQLIRRAALSGVAVVFVSSEIDEILELASVVVTMFAGEVIATRPRSDVTAEILSADMTVSRERKGAHAA